jgi:fructose-1,6-bisphosphatase I
VGSTPGERPTLAAHLRAQEAGATLAPPLARLLETLAETGARLAAEIARAPLTGALGETGEVNTHGDRVRRLDARAGDLLLGALRATGSVAAVASEELATPVVSPIAPGMPAFAVCLDPIDGSLNTDVAGVLGTIFGVRPVPAPAAADPMQALLGPGTAQLAAGYLVFGPATVFVYTAGRGVQGFVRDPVDACFRLTHPDIRMPARGRTYAVNDANWPGWGPAPRALVEWLRAPGDGARYSLRYSGALVADLHRTLLEGGIYFYPRETGRPDGRIRLLYEAAPLALIAEAAGGRASTGRGRILEVVARDYHQRTPIYIGSRAEVEEAERLQRAHEA